MACLTIGTLSGSFSKITTFSSPLASLSFGSGSRTTKQSFSFKTAAFTSALLPSSSLSFSSNSTFSGLSLGLELGSNSVDKSGRRQGLVVRAKKYSLCQTKRNRSRKSLARTHGFRKRMSTVSGRATIKRRRAKGRWNLCTKTNPTNGKGA
ncbi:ribosomal protein [Lithospermum erythrorhizon]|uniref:Large ribosomal subunit protein bL34c n=1 Tax=Lithospermum erythrorhizon TaxID=34254 RepID=A0AAV3P0C6_LITER